MPPLLLRPPADPASSLPPPPPPPPHARASPSLPSRTDSSPPGHAPGPEDARQTAPPPRSSARPGSCCRWVPGRWRAPPCLKESGAFPKPAALCTCLPLLFLPARTNDAASSNCESQEIARPADRPTSCRLGGKASRRYREEAAGRRRCPGAREGDQSACRSPLCAFPSVQGAGTEHVLGRWVGGALRSLGITSGVSTLGKMLLTG
ncbi:uncharacterized protein LOC132712430 [Pantherophis guttatus]|uniref:Uncharacterized protein LOC132712430 n=1 Tax=Pantherophis guttatus TaxID=94885 RepID=A0ABM3ZMY9_PANGU|nr:uncharacterized protein LOC132712430 [Pantherophis guttatus]